MSVDFSRHLPLPDTHNIRDLGGYSCAGGTTRWRRILRGDSLSYLQQGARDELAASGLSCVIDLRGPHETGVEPNPFQALDGVQYRNIALFDALSPITMSDTPFDMVARYCSALDQCGPRLAEVLRAIADAPDGMVLFHCTAGKDRTGIVAAVLLLLVDVAPDDVVDDYALTATIGRELILRLRERAEARGTERAHIDLVLASDASTMIALLAHLQDHHGGVFAYSTAIGLEADVIERLVDRLCR